MAKKNTKSKKKLKSIIFMTVLSLVVILVFAYLLYTGGKIFPEKDKTIATVNGEKIKQSELDVEMSKIPEQYKMFVAEKDILDQLIEKKLLLQEASEKGITVSDEEVNSQVNLIKSRFQSESLFEDALKQQNLTLDLIKTELKDQILMNKLLNETAFKQISVSEKDIADYYNQNIDQFKAAEGQVRIGYLLVGTEEEAKKLSEDIKKGAEFEKQGNDQTILYNSGFFSKGSGLDDIEAVAFKLNVGEVSSPTKTQTGYFLIKRLSDVIELNDAKEKIRDIVFKSKQDKAIESYLNELKSNAKIENVGDKKAESLTENAFKETGDEACNSNGKLTVMMLSSSDCESCKAMKPVFEKVMSGYSINMKEIELDTGDDLATEAKEDKISLEDYELIKKYDSNGAVPAYIIGCKYARIGNAYEGNQPELEEQSLVNIMNKMVNNG